MTTRKPLSMRRLHQLSANFLIREGYEGEEGDLVFSPALAEEVQAFTQPIIFKWLKYVWEHKDDDDIFDYPFKKEK